MTGAWTFEQVTEAVRREKESCEARYRRATAELEDAAQETLLFFLAAPESTQSPQAVFRNRLRREYRRRLLN